MTLWIVEQGIPARAIVMAVTMQIIPLPFVFHADQLSQSLCLPVAPVRLLVRVENILTVMIVAKLVRPMLLQLRMAKRCGLSKDVQ